MRLTLRHSQKVNKVKDQNKMKFRAYKQRQKKVLEKTEKEINERNQVLDELKDIRYAIENPNGI